MTILKFKKLIQEAIIPVRKYKGDAGLDLFSSENKLIAPGEVSLINSGLSCEFPEGYELQVRSRSGLALNNGIAVLNSPGTIDSGYRGEIKAIIINHGKNAFKVEKGDKIAQLVFCKLEEVEVEETDNLTESDRAEKGFGSSGVKNG